MTPPDAKEPPALVAELEICNRLGLHARAASSFVRTAAGFDATVEVGKDGRWVDGKGILGLMTLEAPPGSTIVLRVSGSQARPAFDALVALVGRGFDEDDPA